jgi:hypothetical protein
VLASGLPEIVADDEDLVRLLTSSSQRTQAGVKPAAFMPNPKDWAKSVIRHPPQSRAALWQLGREYLGGGATFHGAAIVQARQIREVTLDVLADEPPPRHANIVGWPQGDDPVLAKDRCKQLAARLAQSSTMVKPPTVEP